MVNFSKKSISFIVFIVIAIVITYIIHHFFWANDQNIVTDNINPVSQNALVWAKRIHFKLNPQIQKKLAARFLNQYFAPWNDQYIQHNIAQTRALELTYAKQYLQKPEWGENRHRHTKQWVQHIVNNMNLNQMPNITQKGIIIEESDVRQLPTEAPIFRRWSKAGEGYPFDYMQIARAFPNTPVVILNQTKDGAWYLIQTAAYIGWVQSHRVAFVNQSFIKNWKKSSYVVATKEFESIWDQDHRYRGKTHLTVLYPLISRTLSSRLGRRDPVDMDVKSKNDTSDYQVLLAAPTENQYAKSMPVSISKNRNTIFPIPLTMENLAKMANRLIGTPYGWGDLDGYRDCASFTMALFSNFGIWLPINSTDQIKKGHIISLKGLSDTQKIQQIIEHGLPFLTILHKHDHIMIYLFHQGNRIYILHAPWGTQTTNLLGTKGRAVIGKVVIMPIQLSHFYLNASSNAWLPRIDKMSVLYH